MGATAQVNPAPTVGKTTTERFDIAYGFKYTADKDGKVDPASKTADVVSTEKAEELSAKNLFEGSIVTVSVDYPSTFEGLVELSNTSAKDDDGSPREQKDVQNELVKLFVNGAKAKVMNRLRALLTKTDDKGNLTFKEPGEGEVLDLTYEITSGSRRVFLSEEQKMWKSLAMLAGPVKDSVWKAYLSSVGKDYYVPAE